MAQRNYERNGERIVLENQDSEDKETDNQEKVLEGKPTLGEETVESDPDKWRNSTERKEYREKEPSTSNKNTKNETALQETCTEQINTSVQDNSKTESKKEGGGEETRGDHSIKRGAREGVPESTSGGEIFGKKQIIETEKWKKIQQMNLKETEKMINLNWKKKLGEAGIEMGQLFKEIKRVAQIQKAREKEAKLTRKQTEKTGRRERALEKQDELLLVLELKKVEELERNKEDVYDIIYN